MYVIETKTGEWFCSESKKEIEKIIGKAGSIESIKKCKNLWYQPLIICQRINYFIMRVLIYSWWKTKMVTNHEDFVGWIRISKCCKIGPITNEKYCPKCGRRIVKW